MGGKRPAGYREDRRREEAAGEYESDSEQGHRERAARGDRNATARAYPRMEHVRPPATADEGARDTAEEHGVRRLVKPEPDSGPDADHDGNGRSGAQNECELEGEHGRDHTDEARARQHRHEGADERPTDGFGVERASP